MGLPFMLLATRALATSAGTSASVAPQRERPGTARARTSDSVQATASAAPVGGLFDAPHGAVCAALLPAVLRVNLRGLRQRQPASPALARYREIAAIVTGRPDADAEDAVAWMESLRRALAIPGLSRWGATEADIGPLVAKARAASSMKGNPIELEEGELAEIARASL